MLASRTQGGGLLSGMSFFLPLGDSGSGAVNTTPVSAAGSPTATFTRATTATTIGPTGLVVSVGSGVARSYYDPTTLSYLGYLAEGARTNSALWARDHTNAAWTKTTMTAALDQTGNDGGANSASSLLATAGNATSTQAITLASAAKTVSFDIKRLVGTGAVQISLDNFTTNTDVTALINSSTYTRVTMTQTLANPTIGIRLVTNGDKIAVDYSQLEDSASFASSHIPTTTVAVTRNADVLTYASSGNALNSAGSLYAEMTSTSGSQLGCGIHVSDGTLSNGIELYNSELGNPGTRFIVRSGAASQADISIGTAAVNVVFKSAGTYAANVAQAYFNGTTGTLDTLVTVPVSVSQINIGGRSDGVGTAPLFGTIRNVRIWTIQLTDSQLQGITT